MTTRRTFSFMWPVEEADGTLSSTESGLAGMAFVALRHLAGEEAVSRLVAEVDDPRAFVSSAVIEGDRYPTASGADDLAKAQAAVMLDQIGLCLSQPSPSAFVRLGMLYDQLRAHDLGVVDLIQQGAQRRSENRQRGNGVRRTRNLWHSRGHVLIRDERQASPRATLAEVAAKVHPKLAGGPATVGGLEQEMRKWVQLPADDPRHLAPFPRRRGPVAAESHS
jgi:hypothetical protein